jgi:glucokinase
MGETRGERIEIVQKEVMPTDRPVYDMIEALFVCAERMLEGLAELEGIGISCGGPLSSKRGMILSPPNLPGWDNIPIVKMAEERFGKRTLLQNDANACAMAEWRFGAGMGYNNVIFLTFGTGMGAGLILDGRLYSGTTDLAGEVGHLRLSEMGPVGFGKAGSFEGWASGGGIAQLAQIMVRAKLQMGEKVSFCAGLGELHLLTAKVVAEAAYGGDPLAIEIYRVCGQYLGRGLSLLIDVLNPEIIILGSIFGRVRPLIEDAMRAVIDAEALADSNTDCRIVPAGLGESIGDMAALTLADIISKEKT